MTVHVLVNSRFVHTHVLMGNELSTILTSAAAVKVALHTAAAMAERQWAAILWTAGCWESRGSST